MGNATMGHRDESRKSHGFLGFIVRFVVAALVLMVTAYFVPGFAITGFTTALIAALVIAGVDWLVSRIFHFNASPFGRGIAGFIVSAAILYFSQFLVAGFAVTITGALIGALVIGIIDAIVPTKFM